MTIETIRVPKTELHWTTRLRGKSPEQAKRLHDERPIVTWFNKRSHIVCCLVKISPAFDEDLWILNGYDYTLNKAVCYTKHPLPLEKVFAFMSRYHHWNLCEFKTGREYLQALTEYIA